MAVNGFNFMDDLKLSGQPANPGVPAMNFGDNLNFDTQLGNGLDTGNAGFFGNMDLGGMSKGFGSIAGGIGGLAQAWQGMQGLKLAKDQLKTQNAQWEKNYSAQRGDIDYDRAQRADYRSKMRR